MSQVTTQDMMEKYHLIILCQELYQKIKKESKT